MKSAIYSWTFACGHTIVGGNECADACPECGEPDLRRKSPAAMVYVVMGFDYEDAYIESVWTTKEAADKHLAEFTPPPSYENYYFAVEAHELRTDA